jgi:hypothetical protein
MGNAPRAAAAAALVSLAGAACLSWFGSAPVADVARGSEEAFTAGLFPRELAPRQAPRRWTTDRTLVAFRNLSSGQVRLVVAVREQRGAVGVAAAGRLLGTVPPGTGEAVFDVEPQAGSLDVELRAETFVAGDGRRLGATFDRVSVEHRPSTPRLSLVLLLAVPAVVLALSASTAGFAALPAGLIAGALGMLQAALLWPCGLWGSPYASRLSATLACCSLVAGAFARWMQRRAPHADRWAFGAALATLVVQGVLATSPLLVVSDVVFHANKLAQVAGGDLYPVSRTQHAHPFTIPYGVSFYALLAPLFRAGFDAIALVRFGAALSGIAASLALFAFLARADIARAGPSTLLLTLMPGVFAIYSYGNLSNVFAQAVTVFFFLWWAGVAPLGWPLGAALLAVGCLAHLSGLVVLGVLALALLLARGRTIDRGRAVALAVGLATAALYYAHFWRLVLDDMARLGEGGGGGHGMLAAILEQATNALVLWGAPGMALALLGARATVGSADRDLGAFWAAGLLLAGVAIVSPLDVRYLYALTLPLAVAAGGGYLALARRGLAGQAGALLFLLAQAGLLGREVVDALLHRYRLP